MLHQSKIDNNMAGQANGCDQLQLHDRAAVNVFHDSQRDVYITSGSDREVPHRHSVAHQDNGDQLIGGVAAPEVECLADYAVGNQIAEVGVDRCRLVESGALEGMDPLQETILSEHMSFLPVLCATLARDRGRG